MTCGTGEITIDYQPRLVEGTVLLAVRGREEEEEFLRRRDRIYETPDPEEREAQFLAFNAMWFERLGLGRPLGQALFEQPLIMAETNSCLVSSAVSKKDEGADLYVAPAHMGGRSVVIRARPERLVDAERAQEFLRHELLHVADMLDPRFEYQPSLPVAEVGPQRERLLQDRYRVLWDVYVDGRLSRLGWAPGGIRTTRLSEFSRTFPMLGEQAAQAFERFFGSSNLTHPELVAFAIDPERVVGSKKSGPHPGSRCALCGFPTFAFEPADQLFGDLTRRISEAFPKWNPADGVCCQCADLYRSRLSAE